ncbi:MAG TPA: helix-turn-helix domain-containing protein [Jatrophihabitans sp.]|nr:helix-turn-helix domain-containing protein [Jatrophihabitans sp.]
MQERSDGHPAVASFGGRLRALRQNARLTQDELAERAGLSTNGVSALERGTRRRPQPHTARKLAQALLLSEADRDWLFRALPPDLPEAAEDVGSSRPGDHGLPAAAEHRLPAPITELVGRDAEVSHVLSALIGSECRLLTLTGPGGVGKTRLAVEVAGRAAGSFGDGVVFVSLAPVSEAASVPAAIARELGVRDLDSEPGAAVPALIEQLRHRDLLLVLDNFEHLLAAASTVVELLAGVAGLRALVTSRAPLRVSGEREHVVPPLTLPPSTQAADPRDVSSSPAGQLFLARARAVLPSFELTEVTAGEVAAICWRLAGLPLALELAAANVRLLSPQDLLRRLDQALATGWTRDLPARQRGLRTTLDWSYQLLDPNAQALLPRLAVFAGGFDLDAAEAVAAEVLDPLQVLPALGNLVEHSLVRVHRDPDGQVRYDLLEPIRQYADSLLAEADRPALTAAHAACYLRLVELAAPALQTGAQVEWLGRLEREDGNVRRAISQSLESGDAGTAARMCWAMWLVWWMRGGDQQGRDWTEAALRSQLSDEVRAQAATAAACLSYVHHDYQRAAAHWQQALEISLRTGDLGMQANALGGLGLVPLATGDLSGAEGFFHDALQVAERAKADWLRSLLLVWLGTVQLVRGETRSATELFERGLAAAQRRADRLVSYIALYNLAQAATAEGRLERASQLLQEGVALSQETGDRANTSYFLDALAVVAGQAGHWVRAAVLMGAAQAALASSFGSGYNYYLPDLELKDRTVAQARAAIGTAFDDALHRGQQLPIEAAVAEALADPDVDSSHLPSDPPATPIDVPAVVIELPLPSVGLPASD